MALSRRKKLAATAAMQLVREYRDAPTPEAKLKIFDRINTAPNATRVTARALLGLTEQDHVTRS